MLARIHKSMKEKDEGFTLIELLVVMIIIGILAAIAIPVFLNQRKKAVDTGVKSDVTNAGKNIASYYVDGTASTLFATIVGGQLNIGTTSGSTDIAQVKLSNANTALPAAASIGLSTGTGCSTSSPATAWYIGLLNSSNGSGTTYWYSAQSGLTTSSPAAIACTNS